jgi:hypothetical protein
MRYRAVSALGTLLSCVMVAAVSTAPAEEGGPESALSLEILLTIAPSLPTASRGPLLDEATRIWRSQGVTIDWLSATASPRVTNKSLRVLVIPRRGPAARQSDSLAVGELLGPGKGHAVAIVSIEAAERLVQEASPPGFPLLAPLDHRRLGLVLGRAVAHEIGHYLLDTPTHARHGLMRPRFDAREFSDLRPGTFTLDPDASQWLKDRFLQPTGVTSVAGPARFSYAR